jgi:serine palmitoyltransferase
MAIQASQVDMLIGSVATSLAAGGGFCAGSHVVVDHQRINGAAFVFSASMPGLLATSASEGIRILRSTPSLLSTLQENVRAVRAVLDKTECIDVPSHSASPLIHIHIHAALTPEPALGPTQIAPPGPPPFDIASEDRLLQDIADECGAQGVGKSSSRHDRASALPCPPLSLARSASARRRSSRLRASRSWASASEGDAYGVVFSIYAWDIQEDWLG